jgi:hypothetical protein
MMAVLAVAAGRVAAEAAVVERAEVGMALGDLEGLLAKVAAAAAGTVAVRLEVAETEQASVVVEVWVVGMEAEAAM